MILPIILIAASMHAPADTTVTVRHITPDSTVTVTTIDYGTVRTAPKTPYAARLKEYKKLAGQNQPMAQYNLGMLYYNGQGTAQDYKEALKWWRRAAERHHAPSQDMIARCYRDGTGVKASDKEAAQWWSRAAADGHAPSMYTLATLYATGRGLKTDPGKALMWLTHAAAKGHNAALYDLACLYAGVRATAPLDTLRCEPDAKEAERLMTLAANAGHTPAAAALARWYTDGVLTPDPVKAARYARMAK